MVVDCGIGKGRSNEGCWIIKEHGKCWGREVCMGRKVFCGSWVKWNLIHMMCCNYLCYDYNVDRDVILSV